MSTITTRAGKGSPLTNTEVDANFTNLNTDKAELSGATFTGDVKLGDNDKATFGAGDDLQIYHNSFASIIKDSGVGDLYIGSDNNLLITNSALSEVKAKFTTDGAVDLYHNNSSKLSTTSTGINVTGTATMDGLTFSTAGVNFLKADQSLGSIMLQTNGANTRAYFSHNGDISFNEDTGTTAKFFWDASAESLGIGTTSPSEVLGVYKDSVNQAATQYGNSTTGEGSGNGFVVGVEGGGNGLIWNRENSFIRFGTNAAERLRIDSSGNVGIGTSTPNYLLDIEGTGPLLRLNATSGNAFAQLSVPDSTSLAGINFGDTDSSNTGQIIYRHNGNSMAFTTNSSEAMRITSSGNVGIGTGSPATALEVNGDIGIGRVAGGYTFRETVGGNERASLKSNASNELLFNIGASAEAMRIDSSGRVGIGVTDPAEKLQVNGNLMVGDGLTAGSFIDVVGAGASQDFGIRFGSENDRDNKASILATTTTAGLRFFTNGANERMRINSSGNVGIGTSSPSHPLTIQGSGVSGNAIKILGDSTNSSGRILWRNSADSGGTGSISVDSSKDMVFGTGTSAVERMRIDSSGNLLVGKSATGLSTDGAELAQGGTAGKVQITRTSNAALLLNRRSSDGTIADFRKDGTTVGSIGTRATYLTIGKDDIGLLFNSGSNRIQPENITTGAVTDNLVDLGYSGGRFKDAYLSGGVYLGGTGAANKLDDYEEGTFTASLRGGTSEPATLITADLAKYTKIGDMVHIEISFENETTTGYAGALTVTGLPFTSGGGRTMLSVGHYQDTTWADGLIPISLIASGSTQIDFLNTQSGSAWSVSQHNSAGGGRYLWVSGAYKI